MTVRSCFVWLSLAVFAGCGTEIPPEPPASNPAPAPVAADAPAVTPAPAAPASTEPAPVAAEGPAVPAATTQPPAAEPAAGPDLAPPALNQPPATEASADMERVKAEQGVGLKGRSLDEHEGVMVTPAKVYFNVREKVIFNIRIPDALNKYKALNGNAPKSHDEFMTQIIEANLIQLPELPAGQRYVYDPQQEELMVERPR